MRALKHGIPGQRLPNTGYCILHDGGAQRKLEWYK